MSSVVDASALLAALLNEPGSQTVVEAIRTGASLSAVNLSEVVAKLADAGMPDASIRQTVDSIDIEVIDFDAAQAYLAGSLRAATRSAGLSLGDRACLALAQRLGRGALTADRAWAGLNVSVPIQLVR